MIHLTHTSPGRLLGHLCKLTRQGESLLARPPFLTPLDELSWDARVWKCLAKIAAPNAFAGATQLDRADVGEVDLLDFDRLNAQPWKGTSYYAAASVAGW